MSKGFEARTSLTIDAPRARVWDALTNPEKVKQYMHGTNLQTDWRVGAPVRWTGEWKGQPYEDKGIVLAVEPESRLSHTHWSPMGGSADTPENYHTVTYLLEEDGAGTKLTLIQDNNATPEAAEQMAEQNWRPVLQGLKATAEQN